MGRSVPHGRVGAVRREPEPGESGRRPEARGPGIELAGTVERTLVPALGRGRASPIGVSKTWPSGRPSRMSKLGQDRGTPAAAQDVHGTLQRPKAVAGSATLDPGAGLDEQQERPEDGRRPQLPVEADPVPDVGEALVDPPQPDPCSAEQQVPAALQMRNSCASASSHSPTAMSSEICESRRQRRRTPAWNCAYAVVNGCCSSSASDSAASARSAA